MMLCEVRNTACQTYGESVKHGESRASNRRWRRKVVGGMGEADQTSGTGRSYEGD